MTGIGQKWSLAEVSPNVGFLIIKRSSGRFAAAQNHLVARYVGSVQISSLYDKNLTPECINRWIKFDH
jgi:hypothetical protein